MAFAHTPYDGTSHPFTVGLKPIAHSEWLETDEQLIPQLTEKARLLDERYGDVFQVEPGTEDAQAEVLDLVLAYLAEHRQDLYRINEKTVQVVNGPDVDLMTFPQLEAAARLVQEDLVLMRSSASGYRLVGACLCFPSSWSLSEKFGRAMPAIHESVPGFNSGRMGTVVSRLFENLKLGQLVCRYNWSIYDDEKLYHPEARQLASNITRDHPAPLAPLFLRVERQTLRRLAGSGDILFTIRIHHDPMSLLKEHPDRAAIATGLHRQLLALDPAQLSYKGLVSHRDMLAEALLKTAAH
ncbi:MAG: DUF3445 domain-containing protein [Roseibium sp.]|nr:DUF3445 domain-containing protein [Roseibium sp.]